MAMDQADRTSLAVVRVWFEDGRLRARLTTVADIAHPAEVINVYESAEAVEAALHDWLTGLRPP